MTTTHKKLRIGIIFGGRSCEHEVSLVSAKAVMSHLDKDKYEIVPIAISRTGAWLPGVEPLTLLAAEQERELEQKSKTPSSNSNETSQMHQLMLVNKEKPLPFVEKLDVVFPVLHGTYGEDGTIQGLLEMANVPYVGCGVMGSALGMDKDKMKKIFQAATLPIVDSLVYRRHDWQRSPQTIVGEIEERLGYPCFVKPANAGSSIGVSKVYERADLEHAMKYAASYDSKIIIEHAINCRELECSVLGNNDPIASVVGEVIVHRDHDFYDYQAKYLDHSSQTIIPADIPYSIGEKVRQLAIRAFEVLDLSGLARVDFFLEKETNQIYLNEVNTLPSFTPQCMYSRLCEKSGYPYTFLLDRLIELALERYADRQKNSTSWMPYQHYQTSYIQTSGLLHSSEVLA